MTTFSIIVSLGGDNFNENRKLSNIKVSKMLKKNLGEIFLNYKESEVKYRINWENVEEYYLIQEQLLNVNSSNHLYINHLYEKLSEITKGGISVEVNYSNEILGNKLKEHLIIDLFIILNIVSPGFIEIDSFIFNNSTTTLKLWSTYFEYGYVEAQSLSIGLKLDIELKDVVNWYYTENANNAQIAETHIQKCIFSLMHLCRIEEPASLLSWSSVALEALYNTPKTHIQRSLKYRINRYLNHDNNLCYLNNKIRNYYKFRSRFVHGKFTIIRPESNDHINNKELQINMSIYKQVDFAISIILLTLQKNICMGDDSFNMIVNNHSY